MTVFYLTRGHWLRVGAAEVPCKRCGKLPTPEGYDACLGYLPGVASACCGHGVKPGRVYYKDGHIEEE